MQFIFLNVFFFFKTFTKVCCMNQTFFNVPGSIDSMTVYLVVETFNECESD